MSDHVEELAKIIQPVVMRTSKDIARAIIAAGWRPPEKAAHPAVRAMNEEYQPAKDHDHA